MVPKESGFSQSETVFRLMCTHIVTFFQAHLPYTPVTLYRDYTELAWRCEISQSAVGSPKNAENRCILFSIFTPWRLWRFYGDSTECYRVPAEL